MSTIHVKAKFENSNIWKRFQIESTMSYSEFLKKIQEMYSIQNAFYIKYIDEENDTIRLSNEEEYIEAIHVAKDSKVFKIFITVDYNKPLEEIKVFLEQAYDETAKVVNQFVEKLQDKETHEYVKNSLNQLGIMVQGGAVSAYNSTQQAINNLQNKIAPKTEPLSNLEDVEVNVEQPQEVESAPVVEKVEETNFEKDKSWMVLSESKVTEATEHSQFANELTFLGQMGFVDVERNVELLTKYQGDITQVVQVLLSE